MMLSAITTSARRKRPHRLPARSALMGRIALLGLIASLSSAVGAEQQALTISPNGRVAIGGSVNAEPVAPLDIGQSSRIGTNHPDSVDGLYVTGNFQSAQGVEFRHDNGTQGIGIGYNTLYATGSDETQHLFLKPRGSEGRVEVKGNLTVTGGLSVSGTITAARLNIPGMLIGTFVNVMDTISQNHRLCMSSGVASCSSNHGSCPANAQVKKTFHSYCKIYPLQIANSNKWSYCYHYACYSQ